MRDIIETLKFYGFFEAAPLSLIAVLIYSLARTAYLKAGNHPRARVSEEIARGLLVWYLITLVVVVWFIYLPELLFGKISVGDFCEMTFFHGEYASNGRFEKLLRGDFSVFSDGEFCANIALFVPYGILLPTAFRRLKWWAVDLAALGTTLVIEIIQPFFGRSCDLDDIIANTLGAAVGCAAAKLVITLANRKE